MAFVTVFTNKMTMKTRILLFCCIILALSGCKAIDNLTQFEMDYDQTVVIPANIPIDLPYNVLTPDIETDSETSFSINNTRKDLIEKIYLTELSLTITSPSSADFSFLESIEIYISADGLQEVKVAYKDPVPANDGTVLNMDLIDIDIKDYIKKDSFTLKLKTVTDELLSSDHQINVHSVFFIDAKILGQ